MEDCAAFRLIDSQSYRRVVLRLSLEILLLLKVMVLEIDPGVVAVCD